MIFLNEEEKDVKVSSEVQSVLTELANDMELAEDSAVAFEDEDFDLDEELELEGLNEETDEEDAEVLDEALSASRKVVVKTRQQKLARLGQQAAMELAKESSDPLYKKYEKFRKLEVSYRKKIEKKYGSKGKAVARKIASGAAKDVPKGKSKT
jgi:allophanate hydrolase subunit 1